MSSGTIHTRRIGEVLGSCASTKRWRRIHIAKRTVFNFRVGPRLAAFAIEMFLIPVAVRRAIVLPAPLVGALPAVVLPAAERAAEIQAARVAGVCQEANAAVAAPHRAVLQVSTIAQDGIQRDLILTNKRIGAVVLMPILAKGENFRDGYGKRDRFSVRMWIVFCISSSYSLDAQASRGRARIFYAHAQKIAQPIRTIDPRAPASRPLLSCPAIATSPAILQRATWKEKAETPTAKSRNGPYFFFPSSGSI